MLRPPPSINPMPTPRSNSRSNRTRYRCICHRHSALSLSCAQTRPDSLCTDGEYPCCSCERTSRRGRDRHHNGRLTRILARLLFFSPERERCSATPILIVCLPQAHSGAEAQYCRAVLLLAVFVLLPGTNAQDTVSSPSDGRLAFSARLSSRAVCSTSSRAWVRTGALHHAPGRWLTSMNSFVGAMCGSENYFEMGGLRPIRLILHFSTPLSQCRLPPPTHIFH